MIWSIIRLFREGNMMTAFCIVFAEVFVLFVSLPIHEFAHAWAAYKLGDDTARLKGRLTLAPLAHLDLWGALMILFLGFGYAKSVPVNIRNFKNRKRDFALTSIAGPISNLLMAFVFYLISNVFALFGNEPCAILSVFFEYVGYINVCLAVFNLLPVPPLDGSRIATALLPDKYYYTVMRYERYIMLGLFALMFTGVLTTPLSWLSRIFSNGISFLAGLPFRWIG